MKDSRFTDFDEEAVSIAAAAEVFGDSPLVGEALADIGALSGKNARGGDKGEPRTWDAWSADDLRDAAGDFDQAAPAGALLYGLLFCDDKTSARCRYALAARVEKHLDGHVEAAASRIMSREEVEA